MSELQGRVESVGYVQPSAPVSDFRYMTLGGAEPSVVLNNLARSIVTTPAEDLDELTMQARVELFVEEATGGLDKTGDIYFRENFQNSGEKYRQLQSMLDPNQFDPVRVSPLQAFDGLSREEQAAQARAWFDAKQNETRRAQTLKSNGAKIGGGAVYQRFSQDFSESDLQNVPSFDSLEDDFQSRVVDDFRREMIVPQDYELVRRSYEKQLSQGALEYSREYLRSGVHVPEIFQQFSPQEQRLMVGWIQHVTPVESPAWYKEQGRRFGRAAIQQGENIVEGVSRPLYDLATGLVGALDPEVGAAMFAEAEIERRSEFLMDEASRPKFADRFEHAEGVGGAAAKYTVRGAEGLIESLPFTATAAIPVVGLGLAAVGESNRIAQELEAKGVERGAALLAGSSAGVVMGYLERLKVGQAVETGAAVAAIARNEGLKKNGLRLGEAVAKNYGTQVTQEILQEFTEQLAMEVGEETFDPSRVTQSVVSALPYIFSTSAWFSVLFGGFGSGRELSQAKDYNRYLKALDGRQPWESVQEANEAREVTDAAQERSPVIEVPGSLYEGDGDLDADFLTIADGYRAVPDGLKGIYLADKGIVGKKDQKTFVRRMNEFRELELEVQDFEDERISSLVDSLRSEVEENSREVKPVPDFESAVRNRGLNASGTETQGSFGAQEAQAVVDRFAQVFPKSLPVELSSNTGQLRESVPGAPDNVRAAILKGDRVVVNLDRIGSSDDLVRTLAHEQLAHHGLNLKTTEGKRRVLDGLLSSIEAAGGDMQFVSDSLPQGYRRQANALIKEGKRQEAHDLLLEEFVARTAEKVINGETLSVEEQSVFDRVVEWLRKVMGFDGSQKVDVEAVTRETALVVRELARGLQGDAEAQSSGESFVVVSRDSGAVVQEVSDADSVEGIDESQFRVVPKGEFLESVTGVRFALDYDSDSARFAALVLSQKVLDSKRGIRDEDVLKLIPDAEPVTVQNVAESAVRIASAVERQVSDFQNDESITRLLRNEEAIDYYQSQIEAVGETFQLRGETLQRARQGIRKRQRDATKLRQKGIAGLSMQDIVEKGILSALDETLVPELRDAEPKTAGRSVEEENDAGVEEGRVNRQFVKKTEPRPEGRDDKAPSARRWVEGVVDDVIKDLISRDIIKSQGKKTESLGEVREATKKTLVLALDNRIRKLTYGPKRAQLERKLQGLKDAEKMPSVKSRAVAIAQLVNLYGVRENRDAIVGDIEKLLEQVATSEFSDKTGKEKVKGIGRFSALTEDEKRVIPARLQLFVRAAKKALDLSEEKANARLFELEDEINNAEAKVPDGKSLDEYLADRELEFQALTMFGALRSDARTIAEVAAARDDLDRMMREGFLEQERKRMKREARLSKKRKIWNAAMQIAKAKHGGAATDSKMQEFVTSMYMLEDYLYDAVSYDKDPEAQVLVKEIMRDINYASQKESIETFRKRDEIEAGIAEVFGINRDTFGSKVRIRNVFRKMKEAREDLRRFSPEGRALSIQNLLQIYSTMRQADYRDQAETNEHLKKRLDQMGEIREFLNKENPAYLEWLDWVVGFYDRERSELSAVTKEITGLGFNSPDTYYTPAKMERLDGGTSETHIQLVFVPKALSPRIRHNVDLDETAGLNDLLEDRLVENTHYKAFGELNIELRGIFAQPEVQKNTRLAHGEKYEDGLRAHITDVMAGRPMAPGSHADTYNWIPAAFSVIKLSMNPISMAKQVLSIGGFMLRIDKGAFAKHLAQLVTPGSGAWNRMAEIWRSDFRRERMTGNFQESVNIAYEAAESGYYAKKLRPLVDLYRGGMIFNSMGDILPSLIVGQGIYKDNLNDPFIQEGVADDDTAERHFRAMAAMWHVLEMTQQSTKMKDMNVMRRSKGAWKWVTTFQSSQQQYASPYLGAIRNFNRTHGNIFNPVNWHILSFGQSSEAKEMRKQLFVNHFVLPAMWTLGSIVFNMGLGDDPDEDDFKLLWTSMILGPISGFLFYGTIASSVMDQIAGRNTFFGRGFVPADGIIDDAQMLAAVAQAVVQMDAGEFFDAVHEAAKTFNSLYRAGAKVAENYSDEE